MSTVFISKRHHRQEHNMSCLAACSKMLLDFHGNRVEESALRDLLSTENSGTPVVNILKLNASLPNTKAEVHHWSLDDLLGYLKTRQCPCAVTVGTIHLPHWKRKSCLQAVVIHGFDEKEIFLNDPYFDDHEFQVPIKAFLSAWAEMDNTVITIESR